MRWEVDCVVFPPSVLHIFCRHDAQISPNCAHGVTERLDVILNESAISRLLIVPPGIARDFDEGGGGGGGDAGIHVSRRRRRFSQSGRGERIRRENPGGSVMSCVIASPCKEVRVQLRIFIGAFVQIDEREACMTKFSCKKGIVDALEEINSALVDAATPRPVLAASTASSVNS